jgi:hypothetical protein
MPGKTLNFIKILLGKPQWILQFPPPPDFWA